MSMVRIPLVKKAMAAVLAATLLGGGSLQADRSSDSWDGLFRGRGLDAGSSAQPTATDPSVRDTSRVITSTRSRSTKADATATSSATCDGCIGETATVQVVHLGSRRGRASADNLASAWLTCSGCSTSAVSVQVLVTSSRHPVKVNNRSIAVNSSCSSCCTSAVALHFVVSGRTGRQLSSSARDLVAQVEEGWADRIDTAAKASGDGHPAEAKARAASSDLAGRLEQIILADLGGS
jgi:hypothetical protein